MQKLKSLFIIIIILLIIFSPRIYWMVKPSTTMDISIVDKTVANTSYREHNGLFWILTNEKMNRPDGELYDIGRDYFGYDPYEKAPMKDYDITRKVDLIYVADTYGVYSDDLEEKVEGERSEKVYGGMDLLEWNAIMGSKGEQTTLIAEYNSFATPTDEVTRTIMEQNLGVKWSGWSGRYFDDLNSDEIPPWLIQNYENKYKEKWPFTGGGMAFVHLSDDVVVIDEKQIQDRVQFELTKQGQQLFPAAKSSLYTYWFDIVIPQNDAAILAKYKLQLSKSALKQLEKESIPTKFPAIVFQKQQKTYYFAGDYADYPKTNLMKWQGSPMLMKVFEKEETKFFWMSYAPIMKQILNNISSKEKVN